MQVYSIVRKKWVSKFDNIGNVDLERISIEFERSFKRKVFPQSILKLLYLRDLKSKDSIIKFFTNNLIFTVPPFLYKDIVKSLKRIKQAIKKKEKILIFGDSDVDGILAIKVLVSYFKKVKANFIYDIPGEGDVYGLSIEKIKKYFNEGVKLIITVDNGISSVEEIEYAKSLGIDVIVTDHHNPKEVLPDAFAIINPKVEKNIPFKYLSGCGVAFKMLEALIFSETKAFNEVYNLVEIEHFEWKSKNKVEHYLKFNIVNVRELTLKRYYTFSIKLDSIDENLKERIKKLITTENNTKIFKFGELRTPDSIRKFFESFLPHTIIITDDSELLKNLFLTLGLKKQFIASLIIKTYKQILLSRLDSSQTSTLLSNLENFKLDYFYPGYYQYFKFFTLLRIIYKKILNILREETGYVAISTIADIMPVVNENRTYIIEGLNYINKNLIPHIKVLTETSLYLEYPIDTDDIIWRISPLLNSPGRFGKGRLILDFFLTDNVDKLQSYMSLMRELNIKRTDTIENLTKLYKTPINPDSLILYYELGDIESGLSGLLASRFSAMMNKPVFVVIKNKDKITGSFRTIHYFDAFKFLTEFEDYFENFGGHPYACGFTIKQQNYESFKKEFLNKINNFVYTQRETFYYDIEISFDEMDDIFFNWYEKLEPFGEGFERPVFLSYPVEIINRKFIGKNNSSTEFIVRQFEKSFRATFFKSKDIVEKIKLSSIKGIIFSLQKNIKDSGYNLRILDLIIEEG